MFKRKFIMGAIVWIALSTSCAPAATQQPVDVNAIYTAAVGTMVAGYFQTQAALATPTSPLPTLPPLNTPAPFLPELPTASPSLTPSPTRIYFTVPAWTSTISLTPGPSATFVTSTINPNSLAVGCNNLAFIRDVTVPAGTVMNPGENFTKTWKVANNGTCSWMYQYHLALISGDAFGAGPTKLGREVVVGDWAEVSVNFDAPKKEGTYVSYWRMVNLDGKPFGATLTVSFKIAKPTPEPTDTLAPTDTPTETPTATPTP